MSGPLGQGGLGAKVAEAAAPKGVANSFRVGSWLRENVAVGFDPFAYGRSLGVLGFWTITAVTGR